MRELAVSFYVCSIGFLPSKYLSGGTPKNVSPINVTRYSPNLLAVVR